MRKRKTLLSRRTCHKVLPLTTGTLRGSEEVQRELIAPCLDVRQADLGVPKMVRGIITQGARGLEGSSSAENRAFVRKYKLAHSLNGKDWTYITDSKTGFAKVGEGGGRCTLSYTHTHRHSLSV